MLIFLNKKIFLKTNFIVIHPVNGLVTILNTDKTNDTMQLNAVYQYL